MASILTSNMQSSQAQEGDHCKLVDMTMATGVRPYVDSMRVEPRDVVSYKSTPHPTQNNNRQQADDTCGTTNLVRIRVGSGLCLELRVW